MIILNTSRNLEKRAQLTFVFGMEAFSGKFCPICRVPNVTLNQA